jgi:hypothetical protein
MASTITKTQIANLALTKLGPGSGYITDFDSDTSVPAQAARRVFDAVRDEVLESHPWRFARKRASLAADTTVPAWGFDQQFTLPSDFLRVLSFQNDGVAYEVEDGVLLCDETAPLYMKYLARVTDTSKFSPTFVSALAARLAVELCSPITKSTTRRDSLWQEYRAMLSMAQRAEAMGAQSETPPDGELLNSRL